MFKKQKKNDYISTPQGTVFIVFLKVMGPLQLIFLVDNLLTQKFYMQIESISVMPWPLYAAAAAAVTTFSSAMNIINSRSDPSFYTL